MKKNKKRNPYWEDKFYANWELNDSGLKGVEKFNEPQMSDCARFCLGLKKLAKECHLKEIAYNHILGIFGIHKFAFSDGSWVGFKRAIIEAGLLTEEETNFNETA